MMNCKGFEMKQQRPNQGNNLGFSWGGKKKERKKEKLWQTSARTSSVLAKIQTEDLNSITSTPTCLAHGNFSLVY